MRHPTLLSPAMPPAIARTQPDAHAMLPNTPSPHHNLAPPATARSVAAQAYLEARQACHDGSGLVLVPSGEGK